MGSSRRSETEATSGPVSAGKRGGRGRAVVTAAIVGSVLVVAMVGSPLGASAAPNPPSLALIGVSAVAGTSGNCSFEFTFMANGIKGSPSADWSVLAILPQHFGFADFASVTTVRKADNGLEKVAQVNVFGSHPNDGHELNWNLILRDPRGKTAATSNGRLIDSIC